MAAGCAATGSSVGEREMVLINMADGGQPPPTAKGEAVIETAFDPARRMSAPVRIDRSGPLQFVIDTGANRSVIASEVAATLGLDSAGVTPVHGIAGVEPAPLVKVKRLSVGRVSSRDLELPVLPADKLGAAGLVGVDVFKDRLVKLDFVSNRMLIGPSRGRGMAEIDPHPAASRLLPPASAPVVVPARYRFGQLTIVDAELGGVPITAFLDSGSQSTVGNRALRDAAVKARPDLVARFVQTPLYSATGQTAHGELAVLPSLRLGGLRVDGLIGVFADLHVFNIWGLAHRPAILIGIDVLRRFDAVDLDFGRKRVIFHPPSDPHIRRAG